MTYLGLDLGTTATKAILVDDGQTVLAAATAASQVLQPRPGISEQDPESWIAAARAVLAQLRADAPQAFAAVRAIGLSGQMHSVAPLDRDWRPLRPALLWNDERGQDQALRLQQAVPGLARITGVRPMASFSAAKLLWLKDDEPALFARIRHVLWPKDYLRLWLTGQAASDMSDAAGTQLFDQAARAWSAPILGAIGLDGATLPPLSEGTAPAGHLRPAVARELGLSPDVVVATGGGDTPVGAAGLGCADAGQAFLSLGTGAVYVAVRESYDPDPDISLHDFAHCLPGRWYQMAAMLNGGSCLAWVAALCREPDIAALLDKVQARGAAPGRILFQPYLRGERTPYHDPAARGAFIGLDAMTDEVDLARAVLEGVAFSLRLGQDLLAGRQSPAGPLPIIGGGGRSLAWTRIIATVLDRPLVIPHNAEHAAALGAARLAMIAHGTSQADALRPFNPARTVEPDRDAVPLYAERYARFRRLYPALHDLTA
ncbi:xylulokinase [Nguyenibacter vanlangensis]|uniref:Xylulose kinase n=1 Tax=Nguyenibacter vanlangensis TaxID=1216886 RepID=A0ABZ3D2V3_9PROT